MDHNGMRKASAELFHAPKKIDG